MTLSAIPLFAQLKQHLLQTIKQEKLQAGDMLPSENSLAKKFKVSRMTARRALQELEHMGLLERAPGLGRFLKDPKLTSSTMTLPNIAEDIRSRGNHHTSRVIKLTTVVASRQLAYKFEIAEGDQLYHSQILHLENDTPIQWDERFVNPASAPDYLTQDFSTITPSVFLSQVAPLSEVTHTVEAVLPTQKIATYLDISTQQPCLQIERRVWSSRKVASSALLIHPANRYRLGAHINF